MNRFRSSRWWLLAAAGSLLSVPTQAQPYVPGQSYFGRNNYIEYIAGDLPIIVSAPHGGTLTPSEIPDRDCTGISDCSTVTDSNLDDLAAKVRTEVQNRVGHVPHVIICHLKRIKVDCNREIDVGAMGNPWAMIAWNEFQNYIIAAKTAVSNSYGKGFYVDLHGHGHTIQRLELGYLLSATQLGYSDTTLNSTTYENQSSIRTLSQQSPLTFPQLLRGSTSFGALIDAEGYPAVPSPDIPNPGADPYFDGGYNTDQHSSVHGGTISGLQIESNMTGVRDSSANRTAYAQALARVFETYLGLHYTINLRGCVPKLWDVGTGNWNSAGSWYDSALPVSSNHVVFIGPGGASSHNLSALATGNGVLGSLTFSNAVNGAYTLSGNAFTLIGGLTNNSAFPHTINNHITLAGGTGFAANSNTLTVAGNVTNGGNLLTLIGSGNLSLGGVVSGMGGITKVGTGSVTLSNVNSYHGPTTLNAGLLQLSATATFGDGAGAINWSGGAIALSATRDTTNGVIPNPIQMTADTTIQNTTNAGTGTRNFPFGTDSIQTSGGTLTIRNIALGNANTMNLRLQGSGFDFSRPIVFDNSQAADPGNNTVQLDCYNTNGTQVFSGVISGSGRIRRGIQLGSAAGITILTGNNQYTGGTTINAGTLLVNNTAGSGTGSGDVVVNDGGTLGGSGTIAGAVSGSGAISPGASAGTLSLGNGLNLSGGGTYLWQLSSLSTSGAGTNYDQIVLTSGNLALGGTAKLQIDFIGSATAPDAANPFWQGIRSWRIISLNSFATNSGATWFPTVLNGSYGAGNFVNFADAAGNIWLKFIPANAYTRPLIDPLIAGAGSSTATLEWSGVEGQTYLVQHKDNLNLADWITIGSVVAPGVVVSFVDTNGPVPQRFYRVVIP